MFGFLCRCQKRLLLLHSWVLIYDINHKLWDSFSSNTDDLYWFNAGIKVPNTPGSCCVLFKAQNNTFLSYKSEQETTDASQRENCEEPPPARGPSVTTVPQHFWASSWTQWHRVQVVLLLSIKGTVQSNMSLLSLFTHAHVVHNLCAVLLRNKNMFWRKLGIKPFWCLLTKKRDISKYLIIVPQKSYNFGWTVPLSRLIIPSCSIYNDCHWATGSALFGQVYRSTCVSCIKWQSFIRRYLISYKITIKTTTA